MGFPLFLWDRVSTRVTLAYITSKSSLIDLNLMVKVIKTDFQPIIEVVY